jgi:hypothetical protein
MNHDQCLSASGARSKAVGQLPRTMERYSWRDHTAFMRPFIDCGQARLEAEIPTLSATNDGDGKLAGIKSRFRFLYPRISQDHVGNARMRIQNDRCHYGESPCEHRAVMGVEMESICASRTVYPNANNGRVQVHHHTRITSESNASDGSNEK